MHWPLVAAAALAFGSYKVGTLSVWVSVLAMTLKLLLLAVAIVTLGVGSMILWRRFKEPNQA